MLQDCRFVAEPAFRNNESEIYRSKKKGQVKATMLELRAQINRFQDLISPGEVRKVRQQFSKFDINGAQVETAMSTTKDNSVENFIATNKGVKHVLKKTMKAEQRQNYETFTRTQSIERLGKMTTSKKYFSPRISRNKHLAQTLYGQGGGANTKQIDQKLPFLSPLPKGAKRFVTARFSEDGGTTSVKDSSEQETALGQNIVLKQHKERQSRNRTVSENFPNAISVQQVVEQNADERSKGSVEKHFASIDIAKVMNMTLDQKRQGRFLSIFESDSNKKVELQQKIRKIAMQQKLRKSSLQMNQDIIVAIEEEGQEQEHEVPNITFNTANLDLAMTTKIGNENGKKVEIVNSNRSSMLKMPQIGKKITLKKSQVLRAENKKNQQREMDAETTDEERVTSARPEVVVLDVSQILASTTQKYSPKQETISNKIMHGRSQYGFPTIKTLKKQHEMNQQRDLEAQIGSRFKSNPAQQGLVMVDQEKSSQARGQGLKPVNVELDSHAQFLTGDQSKQLGDESAIFGHNPLEKKPGAAYTFMELSDIEIKMMEDNAYQFEKMMLYQKINKVANCAKFQEIRAEHPEYVYYMECALDTDTPLPILSHINGNTLNLANYTLSTGHCQGLNSAAQYLEGKINRVRFDNCGIDDGEMASLLSAFSKFKDFKSIIYRHNELHEESLEGFCKLFKNKVPYHLEELRISACRITPDVTTDLITSMMERSSLKVFELAETVLFEDDIEFIGEFMGRSRELEELVLSGNNMMPIQMDMLLQVVKVNKRLIHLNLSYNNMIEGFSGNNIKKVLSTEANVKQQLWTFLRYNKKLIHLDLTATNLSENAIIHILPVIKRAKSLQGIHLSGNPGVNDVVKNEARRLLKTHPNEDHKTLNLVKFFTPATIKHYQGQWLREAVKIKNISAGKSLVQNGVTDDQFINLGSKMVLTRYLSHKEEIPGSGQWQLLTLKKDPCWVCEREMKGYIFWTPAMSKKSAKILKLNSGEKQAIFEELDQLTADKIDESSANQNPTPVICGQFTDWKPRKMTNLFDFLQYAEPQEQKLDPRIIFENLQANYAFDDQQPIDSFEECTAYHLNMIDEVLKKKEAEVFKDWRVLFEKQLKYKKPFFVNSDVVREMENYRDIYIAPVFARSGRQVFVIQPGETHETLETYSSIIDFRQEGIPAKTLAASRFAQRIWTKPASVFAKWKNDDEMVRQRCLYEHDFLQWKLEKFVKDNEQVALIKKIFYDNFYFLKTCYVETASQTAWPHVTLIGLTTFCQRSGLIDEKNLNMQDIDRMFIASRVEENASSKQQNICRFMFFEAFARIGLQRYNNTGTGFFNKVKPECATPAEALEKAFQTLKKSWGSDSWEEWRWKDLYNQECHDVLNANMTGITKLYKQYSQRSHKNVLEMQDALKIMIDGGVGLGAANVRYAFGMSQMTTSHEREARGVDTLQSLEFVEFLEFIGRIAHAKFAGSELEEQLNLAQKIDYILDDIIPLVGLRRQDPIVEEQESEESSDDY